MGSLQADPHGFNGYFFGALDPGRIWMHVEQLTSILNAVVGSQHVFIDAGIRCRCGTVVYPQPGQKLVGTSYLATNLHQVEAQTPFTVQAGCAVGQGTGADTGPSGVVNCHSDVERQILEGKPDQQYTWAPGVSMPPMRYRRPEVPVSSRYSALSDVEDPDDVEQQSLPNDTDSVDDESGCTSIGRRQAKSSGTHQPNDADGIDRLLQEFGYHGQVGDATVVQPKACEMSRSRRGRATRNGCRQSEQQQQLQQAYGNNAQHEDNGLCEKMKSDGEMIALATHVENRANCRNTGAAATEENGLCEKMKSDGEMVSPATQVENRANCRNTGAAATEEESLLEYPTMQWGDSRCKQLVEIRKKLQRELIAAGHDDMAIKHRLQLVDAKLRSTRFGGSG